MSRPTDTSTIDPELKTEIAEMLVAVIANGFNSGAFRTESILEAIEANYEISIRRRPKHDC